MPSANKCFLSGLLFCLFLIFFLSPANLMGAEAAPEMVKVPAAEPETVPSTVYYTFTVVDEHSEIVIQSDGIVEDYHAFFLDAPPRLVIDVKGKKLPLPTMRKVVDRAELYRIRAAQRQGKVRFVFDLPLKRQVEYQVVRESEWLKVIIKDIEKKTAKIESSPPAEITESIDKPEIMPVGKKTLSAATDKKYQGKKISLDLFKADIAKFFSEISSQTELSFSLAPDVKGEISLRITDVPWDKAVDLVLDYYHLQMVKATDRPSSFMVSKRK